MLLLRSTLVLLLLTSFYGIAFAGMSQEQIKYSKSSYFSGDTSMTKPAITKKSGKEDLRFSEEYRDNLINSFGESIVNKSYPTTSISVNYDEIWESKIISGLTKAQIKKNYSTLNKTRSYWKAGKIQASVVLKKMNSGGKSQYVITEISSRNEVLSKI